MTRPRTKIVIDGRKDAEWLHGGRNWFVADMPPQQEPVPPEAYRIAGTSYWAGVLTFASVVTGVVLLIAWAVG